MSSSSSANNLYFGDNLDILREHVKDASVDLVYLDPPFNSQANYNIIFGGSKKNGEAQIKAFDDTWHWGDESERTYREIMEGVGGSKIADMTEALCKLLGKNDMTAYLVMMTIRLIELRRVLKETGTIYLHCDPTASHYLKIVMDGVFGHKNFRNEIVWWYRKFGRGDNNFKKNHDILLYYSKTEKVTFNTIYEDFSPKTIKDKYKRVLVEGKWKQDKSVPMDTIRKEDGVPMGNTWEISFVHSQSKEKLGYPTQKPLALLERIIKASSNPGSVVLDPFCGCGTALLAAQKLNRLWIGIDITHLAIGLIEQRLLSETKLRPQVIGSPQSYADAENLFERDPWQFEAWAVSRLPNIFPKERNDKSNRGADKGVDGVGRIALADKSYAKILAQVKGGKNLEVRMVREFVGAMQREEARAGIFIVMTKDHVTAEMKREAASAGRFEAQLAGGLLSLSAPKVQIWSVQEHFRKILPDICIQH